MTTITATSHNGIEETCLIYVTIPVGQIELSLVDAEKAEVGVGETLRVQAVAYNSDGTTEDVAQTFDWRVSNGNASIIGNADGSATITGLRGGTVTIGAFATDGSGVNAQMTITVIIPVESFYIIPHRERQRWQQHDPQGQRHAAQRHLPQRHRLTWESSDEGIATVSATGVVTGVSEGTATITVTSHNGIEQTCLVTVSIRTNTIDITVEGGGAAEVSEGASNLTLRATALGPDGTSGSVAQDFNWSVSNTSYATLINHGDGTVTVTGRRAGYVKIAAVAKDGSGVRGEIDVRIIVPVKSCWMMTPSATIYAGETVKLLVNGTPANATYHGPTDFTWESSDENIATVAADGTVTGVSEGTVTITATSHNGLKTTSQISVTIPVGKIELSLLDTEKAEVGVGETLRVQAVAYNNDGTLRMWPRPSAGAWTTAMPASPTTAMAPPPSPACAQARSESALSPPMVPASTPR